MLVNLSEHWWESFSAICRFGAPPREGTSGYAIASLSRLTVAMDVWVGDEEDLNLATLESQMLQ